jgi:hypothetical protein
MVIEPTSRFRGRRGPRPNMAVNIAAAVIAIVVLVVVVSHKQSQFPTAKNCPAASMVDDALGVHVATPMAASDDELLGCFYGQGTDTQVVSVSFAIAPGYSDPCRHRSRLSVSGHEACNVTGTSGTRRSDLSLMVETATLQDQFSAARTRVSLSGLERLAVKVLAGPAPPLHP